MKVYRCNEAPVKAPPKKLSWNEIIQSEGVYKVVSNPNLGYIVVLIYGGVTSILYYREGELEPASVSWSTSAFDYVRVENARVCFEIKED